MRESLERIELSSDDLKMLGNALQKYIDKANATWAVLITRSGQLLAQRGFSSSFDVVSIAALAGGVFNSTMAMAELVGEKAFDEFLQEGKKASLFYLLLCGEFFLVSMFDDRTLPGVIKAASERFSGDIERPLERLLGHMKRI